MRSITTEQLISIEVRTDSGRVFFVQDRRDGFWMLATGTRIAPDVACPVVETQPFARLQEQAIETNVLDSGPLSVPGFARSIRHAGRRTSITGLSGDFSPLRRWLADRIDWRPPTAAARHSDRPE
jgi:hypothetical protein